MKSKIVGSKIGEVKLAHQIGYVGSSQFIWAACEQCGKERWVQCLRGKAVSRHCSSCCNSGSKSPSWKGGKRKHSYGYVLILLEKSDFFYSMSHSSDYVLEHRLVMAKYLGRCLHSWEIVHHRNHIKNDNHIENLQLVSDDRHKQITILENKIKRLERKNLDLEKELKQR